MYWNELDLLISNATAFFEELFLEQLQTPSDVSPSAYKRAHSLKAAVYVTRHFVACVQTPLPSGKIVFSGGEGGSVHRLDTLVKYCVKCLGSLLEFVYYFRRSISENLIHFFRTVLVPDRHHPSAVFTTEPPRKLRATERFRVTVSCWTRCSTFDCLPCSCWLFHISSKIPSK